MAADRALLTTRVTAALLAGVALIHFDQLRDGFRAPKLWLFELGALLLCAFLLLQFRRPAQDALRAQRDALRLWLPLQAVALISLLGSVSPADTTRALWSLTIAGLLLVVACGQRLPFGAVLSWAQVIGVIVGVWTLIDFLSLAQSIERSGRGRLGIQSSLGNPFDVALLLLPLCLLAQARLRAAAPGRDRWLAVAAAVVSGGGVLATATLSAVAGLVLATAVLWWPSRVSARQVAGAALLGLIVGSAIVFTPVGGRVGFKLEQLRGGEINAVLTGRLDGWRVAAEQFRRAPLLGNGFGTYGRQFNEVKEDLLEQGVDFYQLHGRRSSFANAHNEFLEIAAGAGLFGVALIGWWVFQLVRIVRRLHGEDARLAIALVIAATVSALFYFPFRLAAPALLWLLILGWMLQRSAQEAVQTASEEGAAESAPPLRRAAVLASLALLPALGWGAHWTLQEWRAERSLLIAETQADQLTSPSTRDERRRWRRNLDALERAYGDRPHDSRLAMAIGTYWVLGEQPERAVEWYERSLQEEVRPETLANLARALRQVGDERGALDYERRAARLDRFWRRQFAQRSREQR